MKTVRLILGLTLLCIAACDHKEPQRTHDLLGIAGCWKGVLAAQSGRPVTQLRFFSWRPDSSLALSIVYELGPRSRVWALDADVFVTGNDIRWEDATGSVSADRDSMTVLEVAGGEESLWHFVRHPSGDSLMAQLHAHNGGTYVSRAPETRDDGWVCADPAASGIDTTKIAVLIDEIRRGKHDDIHSFLLVKDNRLVVEEYFAASGTRHGPITTELFRDRVHHLASTTKSVTSTLVGIAIDQGLIRDVDEPIYRYLPAYASLFSEEKKRIRISDMLTMRPGFEWRQFGVSDARNDGMRMWKTEDVIRFVLEKQLEAEPGKEFNYSNGTPTVTGAIIKNAAGMEVGEFAERYLFQPLGITDYVWTSYPDGSIETDGGLALRPRDLAKVGQLYLDKGMWNGRRVLSEQWVRESTTERLKHGKSLRWGYGYHWMLADVRIGNRVVRSWFVPGDGNQIVAVFPDLGMVVIFTAGNYGVDPKPVYYSLFEDHILPAALPVE